MKDYKEKIDYCIGSSDIARLTLVSWDKCEFLKFQEDNSYKAYIFNDKNIIPKHYKLTNSFTKWVRIYDDEGLTRKFEAKRIEFYRAGMMGCLIYLEN